MPHFQVNEEFLCTLFAQMGQIKSCKIIREPGNDPYAFIEFMNHQSASTALTAMNKRIFLEKEMKVNWATSPGNQPKADTSAHHHIFVGDLSPEIDQETLREAFAPFGEISNCRIVKDPQTLKSRGYAFVSFVKKAEAENAIQAMHGQWLGSRAIRTNWSTRKPPPPREGMIRGLKGGEKATYDEIYNQSSPTNMTVYFGGLPPNTISDYLVQKQFASFGPIEDVRVFKDKGFAFIKFTTKEAAAHAIEATHNTEVMGKPVKCFWGKENGGEMGNSSAAAAAAAAAAGGMIVGQMGGGAGMATAATLVAAQHAQPQHGQVQQVAQQGGAQYPYSYQQMGYWYQPVSVLSDAMEGREEWNMDNSRWSFNLFWEHILHNAESEGGRVIWH